MPMIYEDGNYLTDKGRALIAKCAAAKTKIDFTRATVGSGTIPDGESPKSMTDLTKYQVDGLISDICTPVPGEAQLIFQVFSQDVAVGFFASEAAIWANDPDEGDILYTYIVIANNPEWIRASNDSVQKFAEFTCISIIDSVQVDVTQINPKAIVTMDALEKRLAQIEGGRGVVFSPTRPTGEWSLWLQDLGEVEEIPTDGNTPLELDTAPLDAPGDFAVMDDTGDGETITNLTDNPQSASDEDIIVAEQ